MSKKKIVNKNADITFSARDAFMEYLHQGTIKAKEIGKTNNLYVTVIVISLKSIDVIHSFVRSLVCSFVRSFIVPSYSS